MNAKDNRIPTPEVEEIPEDVIAACTDEALLAVSDLLLAQNKEAYEVLAK